MQAMFCRMGRNAASVLSGIPLVGSPQALLLHCLANGAYSNDVRVDHGGCSAQ